MWRFPYTAYANGGGAFLIPYIIVLMTIGRPLYFMELALGQFSSCSSVKVRLCWFKLILRIFVKVWAMVPALKGVGYGQLIGTASVVSYCCSLIALSLHFLASSFQSVLPRTVCHHSLDSTGKI